MNQFFLPAVRKIQFRNAAVEKDVRQLPKPTRKRFAELLDDLRNGKIPRNGKNIAHVGNVKKYRLDEQYRVAFSIRRNGTAVIESIGNHQKMEKYMDRVEKETRKRRKSGSRVNT